MYHRKMLALTEGPRARIALTVALTIHRNPNSKEAEMDLTAYSVKLRKMVTIKGPGAGNPEQRTEGSPRCSG